MTSELYEQVTELQDLAYEQSNILAEIIEKLNELAMVYEDSVREFIDDN